MRWVVRIARSLVRVAAVVVGVRVAVGLLGPWPAAVVMAVGLVVGGFGAWATVVEPRLFAPRFSDREEFVVQLRPPAVAEVDHVAFAQALSVVADAYLDECRRQAGLVDEDGFL